VDPRGASIRALTGYLAGIGVGTAAITLLFLGMRAVLDVGGACADGGPYISAQPCPSGVPFTMLIGMFGLFASAGLLVWFGARLGKGAAAVVALGWPALFLSLGWNFLDYAFHPPDAEPVPVWGWLIPGVLFWLMGGAPLAVAIAAWRAARAGRPANRLSRGVASSFSIRRGSSGLTPAQQAAGFATEPSLATDPEARPVRAQTAEQRVEYAPNAWGPPRQAPPASAGSSPPPGDDDGARDLAEDLARLAELHAAGDLTDDEYAQAKRERLGVVELPPS
jgi:hypothetical protein